MRLLADENFARAAVVALEERGHDVLWIRRDAPGSPDVAVLSKAQDEERVLLTFDKDFGELAIRFGLPASSGILLFRLASVSPADAIRIVVSTVESRDDWRGCLTVVDEKRIRMTPLPGRI